MNSKHYCDYITVDEEYRPVMDKATINKKVDTWLSFFPHEKYLKFLQKLQAQLNEGSKSVWLYGNYGTGKSHAALVRNISNATESKQYKRFAKITK